MRQNGNRKSIGELKRIYQRI